MSDATKSVKLDNTVIKLNPAAVAELFDAHTHQVDVLIGLYKMVFPNWDDIEKLEGWPKCNEETWQAICRLFTNFDTKYHPNVMAGGVWLNNGFSVDKLAYDLINGERKPLAPWEVMLSGLTLHMKGLAPCDPVKP